LTIARIFKVLGDKEWCPSPNTAHSCFYPPHLLRLTECDNVCRVFWDQLNPVSHGKALNLRKSQMANLELPLIT